MYETGTSAQVHAYHVMPGMPPPEGERHAHDYRLDVVARRQALDERGMVVDLDVLDRLLEQVVNRLAEQDLDEVVAPDLGVEAVTVEAFARWVHGRLSAGLTPAEGLDLSVRVHESPVAFGGYSGPVASGQPTSSA